jgi:SAM-dependent methyltransferase
MTAGLPPPDWRRAPRALLDGVREIGRQARAPGPLDSATIKRALVPFVHHLPAALRQPLQRLWRSRHPSATPPAPLEPTDYERRFASELQTFEHQEEVHDLPQIYHYWSNRWLRPMLQAFGAEHPEDFIAMHVFRTGGSRFVSLGCGNCDAEIRIAQSLRERGLRDFTLECVDINEAMLERGRVAARAAGLEGCVIPVVGDFNRWQPDGPYDAVIANQSLHHVMELEHLFDAVERALGEHGKFVISDMIGRNGHQRWPEAAALVREYWQELPQSYRRNVQLQRHEENFLDWDCSVEGFEGIRAQDILPLLSERFGFEVFLAFGNIIDPFIDRGFGRHFDATAPWDRDFVDRVHLRDEAEIQAGRITPTHMLAVLGTTRGVACRSRENVSPQSALRRVAD